MIFEKTITVPASTAKLIDRYIGVNRPGFWLDLV